MSYSPMGAYSAQCEDLVFCYYEDFPASGDDDDPITIPKDKPRIILGNRMRPVCLIGQTFGYSEEKEVQFWCLERKLQLEKLAKKGSGAYLDYVDDASGDSGAHGVILLFSKWKRKECNLPNVITVKVDELGGLEVHDNETGRILSDVVQKEQLKYPFPRHVADGDHGVDNRKDAGTDAELLKVPHKKA
ncbi:hypothetical protein DM02DRAFT_658889 [Periconia macrospinosa]|uniref:Uncharacterized protein n=1 Tax=Periconia macrospinosa TaxID=97972 RepID=A0A2V1DFJ1_9PLEO|nr:hypothetical protein DM02DRAFT_658889 [Periconia macrospinosa]